MEVINAKLRHQLATNYEKYHIFIKLCNEKSVSNNNQLIANVFSPTGLCQGMLYKRKKASNEWNKRWFVLTNHYLLYYKCQQVSSNTWHRFTCVYHLYAC